MAEPMLGRLPLCRGDEAVQSGRREVEAAGAQAMPSSKIATLSLTPWPGPSTSSAGVPPAQHDRHRQRQNLQIE